MHIDEATEFDRRAVLGSADVVALVKPGDLDRPTPCAGWTVADLLAHMAAQHRGFAAAARGRGADVAVWEVAADPDPVAAHRAAVAEVLNAFAGPLEHRFALPEISADLTFAPATAIGFHILDYVVHGWDVAVAVGVPYEPDEELLAVTVELAAQVPTGESPERPGAAFAPPVDIADTAAPLDRILRVLGRSPDWPA